MIIVENRIDDNLKIFTAETFWYNDEQGILKIGGMIHAYGKEVALKNVKVFMEDHWWGVKLKVHMRGEA